ELLERHGGIVVLHDFFLGHVLHFDEAHRGAPNIFRDAMFDSHGWRALAEDALNGRLDSVIQYPCSRGIFEMAQGVIVHSKHARDLALNWYGRPALEKTRLVRFPRARTRGVKRAAARKRLGLPDRHIFVCSFGHLGRTKMTERLIGAWRRSPLALDPDASLVFVGQKPSGEFAVAVDSAISNLPRHNQIRITGFVPQHLYQLYLGACDIAVQLRTSS